MLELKISKMYGLNNCEDFILQSSMQHNFIYGINAVGKSSVAKALTHLINRNEYSRQMPFDEEEFSIELKFDTINIKYDNHIPFGFLNLEEVSKKVFVFN